MRHMDTAHLWNISGGLIFALLLHTCHTAYLPPADVTDTALLGDPQPMAGSRTVRPGDTVVITCSKPGTLVDQVLWDKENDVNGGTIAVGGNVQKEPEKFGVEVRGVTQTLTITGIGAEDDGVYRCYTLFQQDYDKTTVTVIVTPGNSYISVTPSPVNEEDYAAIVCAAGPSKPVAQTRWFLRYEDGSEVERHGFESDRSHTNGTVTRLNELNVLITRDMYHVQFVCKIAMPEGNFTESVIATVDTNLRPDEPHLVGFNEETTEGQTVSLACVAPNGKPEAEITWYWDGSATNGRITTSRNPNGTIDTTSTLEFTASALHNNNFFVCSVINSVMRDKREPAKTTNSTIIVKYTPQIEVDTTPTTAFEGGSLVLDCRASGHPAPTRSSWLHNGEPVIPDSRRTVSPDPAQPTLLVSPVASTDKGTWQCESSNEVGTSVSPIIPLTVLHAPICAPRTKRKYAVSVSETVEATCWVEAFPNNGIIFGWRINDTWSVAPSFNDPTDSYLVYSKLNYTVNSQADYKSVVCRADNGVGSMNESCEYTFQAPGPASPPNECIVLDVTPTSVLIDCWEDFDGGSPPTYVLEGEEAAAGGVSLLAYTVLGNSTSPQFPDVSLSPDTTYNMRVCATNRDFAQNYQCTNSFTVKTPQSNDTVTELPLPDPMSAMVPFIVVGVICGIILIIIIVAVVVICKKKQKQKEESIESPPPGEVQEMTQKRGENLDESYALSTSSAKRVSGEEPQGSATPPPVYSQVDRTRKSVTPSAGADNASFEAGKEADFGEPVYDRADGIVGVVSGLALADLAIRAAAREATREAIDRYINTDNTAELEDSKSSPAAGFDNAALVIDTNVHQEEQPATAAEEADTKPVQAQEHRAASASVDDVAGVHETSFAVDVSAEPPTVEQPETSSDVSAIALAELAIREAAREATKEAIAEYMNTSNAAEPTVEPEASSSVSALALADMVIREAAREATREAIDQYMNTDNAAEPMVGPETSSAVPPPGNTDADTDADADTGVRRATTLNDLSVSAEPPKKPPHLSSANGDTKL